MNFDLITQVRYGSSRLPAKVLLNYNKSNLLTFFISNLKKIKNINRIIIACPNDKYTDIFRSISMKLGVELFSYSGNQNNVQIDIICERGTLAKILLELPLIVLS